MNEGVPGVFLTDGRRVTQPCLLIDNVTGSVLEIQDGRPSKRKAGLFGLFLMT